MAIKGPCPTHEVSFIASRLSDSVVECDFDAVKICAPPAPANLSLALVLSALAPVSNRPSPAAPVYARHAYYKGKAQILKRYSSSS
jgi:hypothetical protein